MNTAPLIAPNSIHGFTPKGFRDHVKFTRDQFKLEAQAKKLAKAGPPKTPIKGVSFRFSAKGTPIIVIKNRVPKWLSPDEINTLANFYRVPQNQMWTIVKAKGIEVSKTRIQPSF